MRNHDLNFDKCCAKCCDERSKEASEKYKKLAISLDVAENNKRRLERKCHDLRGSLRDLEKDLDDSEKEVNRLRNIQKTLEKTMLMSNNKQSDGNSELDYKQLFVHRLDFDTTESDLKKFFGRFGAVLAARIIRNPITKLSRGFGYVEFSNEDMASLAMAHKPHWILSRMVETDYAKKLDLHKHPKKSYRALPY